MKEMYKNVEINTSILKTCPSEWSFFSQNSQTSHLESVGIFAHSLFFMDI